MEATELQRADLSGVNLGDTNPDTANLSGVCSSRRGRFSRRQSILLRIWLMQSFWFQMRIAAQHLPVSMPGDECNLFDREAGFKQPACAFVAQVVKM